MKSVNVLDKGPLGDRASVEEKWDLHIAIGRKQREHSV